MSIRRDFHQKPELSIEVSRTAQMSEKTGVAGMMESFDPGKTLSLRADMDALPIKEKKEVPCRHRNDTKLIWCKNFYNHLFFRGSLVYVKIRRSSRKEIF